TPTLTPTSTSTSTPTGTATNTPVPTSTTRSSATPSLTATPCPMSFRDVLTTDWFYGYVRYLYCRGAVWGYGEGTFKPYNNATRAQISKVVSLALGFEF